MFLGLPAEMWIIALLLGVFLNVREWLREREQRRRRLRHIMRQMKNKDLLK